MKLHSLLLAFMVTLLSSPTSAKVFYVDPAHGSASGDGSASRPWKTLEEVVHNNLIESFSYVLPYDPKNPATKVKNPGAPVKAGDTILLYNGLHGTLELQDYINSSTITIMAFPGQTPVLKRVHLLACKNWVLDGLLVSSEPYSTYIKSTLVFLESHKWHGPVHSVTVQNCIIYSARQPWTKASDWNSKMSNGIIASGDSIRILNNTISNINFGIAPVGNHTQVINNTITNFAGDGIRILGSNGIYRNNIVMNCYKVNSNHDDGIQSYTTGGLRVDSNIIEGNIILNYTDPDQPLLGPLQGIGCFDGPFNDWIIRNNIVIVDHWHGISLYGAHRCTFVNNTVLDPSPGVRPGPAWIKIENNKNGTNSDHCIVKNNITNTLAINAKTTIVGNNILMRTNQQYQRNFVDYTAFDFHLLKNSICVDKADDLYAPAVDRDGTPRPQGQHADIGAYEYQVPTGIFHIKNGGFHVSPNPASDRIYISGSEGQFDVTMVDLSGRIALVRTGVSLPGYLDVTALKHGVYAVNIASHGRKIAGNFICLLVIVF